MRFFKNIINKFFFSNLENYHPAKFIFLAFLFSIAVAFFDGTVDYFFFLEEDSLLDALFFDVSTFEIYIRSMIVITFTLFGTLTAFFISKIKKDQQELLKSELKFKTIATYSRDWIYWISPEKSFLYISPSCEEITGYLPYQFMSNPNLLESIVYDEDKEIFDNHNLFSHGHSDEIQFRIVTKDNKIKWLHHLCQPVIKNNEYLGSRVSNIEITKLKNTEFELSKLSEELKKVNKSLYEMVHQRTVEITTFMTQCPYPRAVYDISGKLVSSNPAWNNELKLRNGKENIYDNPLIKYSKLESKIKKVFETGEKFKSHPIYYEQFDKMLILDFYSIKNRKEEIEIIVMNVEDITEQTRSEALSKEIETRKDLIGEIFDFLDAERRNISKELHDRIGQNLMLIKLNAELIKDANLYAPEKSDEIVELTIDTTKAIKQIIHSLYPEEIEKYGLKESIKNMVNRISKLTPINIDLNFRGQYIPLNKRQELAIFRVIQETLNNATRHSKAENISIDIQFTSNMLLGIITDNGIGFRKQSSDSTKFGIKFMEERMENIGGYFELNSRLKEGTTVHLEVPIG